MIDIRSLRDLVRLYYIHHRAFWHTFVLTLVLIVAGAFFWPTKFASEARLLIKPGRENLTVPLDAGERQSLSPLSTQRDPIVDEEKMLTGRPVVVEVARRYLAAASLRPPPQGVWQTVKATLRHWVQDTRDVVHAGLVMIGLGDPETPEDRLADELERKFSVSHGVGSNVMELSVTWDDPAVAQAILQSWVRVYLDQRSAALGSTSLVTFYDTKVQGINRQIDGLQAQLRDRLQAIGGLSASERLEAITKRINELRDRQAEISMERASLEKGMTFAKKTAQSTSGEIVSERDVSPDPAWVALSNQLADLKRRRAEALRVYQDNAGPVQALNDSIARIESELKRDNLSQQSQEKRTPNEISSLLDREEVQKSLRLTELSSLTQTIEAELSQLVNTREEILTKQPELDRLDQTLMVAEKSRVLYLDSLEKARIDQALDESRINNVAVVEEATLNPSRVGPKSLLLLLLALPASALVGLVAIYLSMMGDQRIHDGGRIEERFGVPLWSTINDIGLNGPDSYFFAGVQRLYSMLPLQRIRQTGVTLGLASSRTGEGVSFVAEHLCRLLQAQGIKVRVAADGAPQPALPGEVVILEAADILRNREAFLGLSRADLIVLVIEARASLIPAVDNALSVLRTAFHKVDGVVLNRRRFEVPEAVLRALGKHA